MYVATHVSKFTLLTYQNNYKNKNLLTHNILITLYRNYQNTEIKTQILLNKLENQTRSMKRVTLYVPS